MKLATFLAVTITATSASAESLVLAKRTPQLNNRANFYGGWPIVAHSCPSNTSLCPNNKSGACCPSNTACIQSGMMGEPVCCPEGSNCANEANTVPVCADPSWTLYIGHTHFFCCAADQIGAFNLKDSSEGPAVCLASNIPVPASELATKVTEKATPTGSTIKSTAGATTVAAAGTTTTGAAAGVTTTSASSSTSTSKPNSASKVAGFSFAGLAMMILEVAFAL